MVHVLSVSVALALAAVDPPKCSKLGEDCTPNKAGCYPCCNTSTTGALPQDECEVVIPGQYFKCVHQPKCAAANAQCFGTGQSVMKQTPCCDAAFKCQVQSPYYSSCVNGSAPPPPPPPTCAAIGAQCGGQGHKAMPCCNSTAQCEVVDPYYSKCVDQPTCAATNAPCSGSGQHVMKPTPCCTASDTCSTWFINGSVCRAKGHETCSDDQEQCAGSGASAMDPRPCCDPKETCIKQSDYYSSCGVAEKCADPNQECEGTGKHSQTKVPCCDATTTCVPWGDDPSSTGGTWSLCRAKGHETCSDHEEQCAGAGDSGMKPKACCDAKEKCLAVNPYYSKCDAPPADEDAWRATALAKLAITSGP